MIIKVKINTKPTQTTIIQIYAPTSKKSADQEVEEFYGKLQSVLDALKDKEPLIIMRTLNSKVSEGQ